MPTNAHRKQAALDYLKLGFHPIPCDPGSKTPLVPLMASRMGLGLR